MKDLHTYKDAIDVIVKIIVKDIGTNHKELVQEGYKYFSTNIYNKGFLNWGMWDKKLFNEFTSLDYDFSALCPYQDVHSPLLVYYAIRPLLQKKFFNKRVVEIGCGNGIGIKMASQLLKAEYALGVDLVNKFTNNAKSNFYEENTMNFMQGDSEHLGLETASFDVVTSIESSHLYPSIELFFTEVARILKPGGFFCYTDIFFSSRLQDVRFETFLKSRKDLQLVRKADIAKAVQAAIYNRLIKREQLFYTQCTQLFNAESDNFYDEALYLAGSMGLLFLPWWKQHAKTPFMKQIIKDLNKGRSLLDWIAKKRYFYYLVQKIE